MLFVSGINKFIARNFWWQITAPTRDAVWILPCSSAAELDNVKISNTHPPQSPLMDLQEGCSLEHPALLGLHTSSLLNGSPMSVLPHLSTAEKSPSVVFGLSD